METLYRKVVVSERLPEKGEYLTDLGIRYLDGYKNWQLSEFSKKKKVNENHEEYFEEPDFWLEEIHDPTAQLQSDKAELLEALENLTEYGSTGEDAVEMKREIESLIQKHKK